MIRQITQGSSRDGRPWFTSVTLQTAGLTLIVGGTAYVAGVAHTLDASIDVQPPASGSEDHVLYTCSDGALILDPGPEPSKPLYGQICWFTVPAGCTDLADIDINQLVHVEEAKA